MINGRDGRWVRFVRECLDDVRDGLHLFGRYGSTLLVLSNMLTHANAGPGKRKCIANDNAWH